MKTVKQLLELTNKAIMNNGTTHNQWFINYSGHINQLCIRYYSLGWEQSNKSKIEPLWCTINLNSEGSIQEAYWFIKNRL